MTASTALPSYAAAARRHHDDARLLFDENRLASADHLAGFATECLLKQVQESYLGFTARSGGPPVAPPGRTSLPGHLPGLWTEMANVIEGRSGSRLAAVLKAAPFAQWQVDDRYSDGSWATRAIVQEHLDATAAVRDVVEQAERDGALR